MRGDPQRSQAGSAARRGHQGDQDATALDASDSRHAAIVNEVAKQLRDVRVREEIQEGRIS